MYSVLNKLYSKKALLHTLSCLFLNRGSLLCILNSFEKPKHLYEWKSLNPKLSLFLNLRYTFSFALNSLFIQKNAFISWSHTYSLKRVFICCHERVQGFEHGVQRGYYIFFYRYKFLQFSVKRL